MKPFIRLRGVTKVYRQGEAERAVLQGVDLDIHPGEVVAIRGRSGSGKTTLLNLIAGLDTPTEGEVWVDGLALNRLDDRARTHFRRDNLGIVFQFFNLIPTLTVLENVLLPAELAGGAAPSDNARAHELLEAVDLAERAGEFPDRLSGGEQQRVAIARALLRDPRLVLADEPTGNLDPATGDQILGLLKRLTRARGKTMILVTHSHQIAAIADRVLTIRDGRLVPETLPEESDAAPASAR